MGLIIMLEPLRIFIKVTEMGSFSKAADVLHLAPSSVARAIDRLEEEMGVTLLKRSTRCLSLTTEGQIFLDGAARLIEDTDDLIGLIKKEESVPQGRLNISCFESFGRTVVLPILPEFMKTYPNINIIFEMDNRVSDLIKEDVDVAIRIGQPQDSGLKFRQLKSNQTVVCASPRYLDSAYKLEVPGDLQEHNCLLLNRPIFKNEWFFTKGNEKQKIKVKGNLTSKGGTPLLMAAIAGVGVGQLPLWMVESELKTGVLVRCLEQWQSSIFESHSGEVFAVYPQRKFPKLTVRVFLDFLLKKCGNTSYI